MTLLLHSQFHKYLFFKLLQSHLFCCIELDLIWVDLFWFLLLDIIGLGSLQLYFILQFWGFMSFFILLFYFTILILIIFVFFLLLIIINFFIFLLLMLFVIIFISLCFLIQITDSVRNSFHNYFFFRAWLLLLRCRWFGRSRLCFLKLWVFNSLIKLLLLIRFYLIRISLLSCLSCNCSSCLCYLWSSIVYFGQFHSLEVIIHSLNLINCFASQEVSWAMLLFALSFSVLVHSWVTSNGLIGEN